MAHAILMTLAGLLLLGVVSDGVTARKVLLGLVGLVLLGVSAFGELISAFGYEAVSTGSNPGAGRLRGDSRYRLGGAAGE